MAFNNDELKYKLADIPYYVNTRKEYYRFITSGFVHQDIMHLFLNMFVLYNFGTLAEDIFNSSIMFGPKLGNTFYLIFYITAIIVANLPTYIKHKFNTNYIGLGASGATSAVIFACILFIPTSKILFFGVLPIPAWIFGILYILYESYAAKNVNDNVAHDVHFAGAIYGVLFVSAYNPTVLIAFIDTIKRSFS